MKNLALVRMSRNLYLFFSDGIRSMTIGRTLWAIVIIKLFIMFAILKVFFFPDFLKTNYQTETQRADHVRGEFIERGL